MAPPLLTLQDVNLTFGTKPLLEGAEIVVNAGDRLCLVGRNGSGKSTLLKIAAGLLQADAGARFVQPGATVRYLPQEPDFGDAASVAAYVEAGLGPGDDPHRARSLLAALGLTGDEAPARLSGGEARRAALARALAPAPDILLLDEPTNHLDLPAIAWLEAELSSMRSAIVLISHDRRLLDALSRAVVWLDGGITRRLDRGFPHFETWRDEVLEAEATERHKLGRKVAMEEDWLRYGVTARRKRNVRRLAGLHALRAEHRQKRARDSAKSFAAVAAELSGKLVAVTEDVEKSFGDRKIVSGLTTRILRGDRVGIVGPNGAGKTTLLGLLTGTIAPDAGEIRLGTGLEMISLDQRRASLNPAATLAETLTGGSGDQVVVNGQARHVIGYMKDFLFAPEQARTPVGVLSGGERGRLALAVALARPCNLLVLDEPTNDLDLETLDLLQELLADFTGTVLLVSHDRDFLDRVCTSVINAEGDGRWQEYAGGYSDMLVQRGPLLPASIAPRIRPTASVASAPESGKKLTFRDRHALTTLPDEITRLQGVIDKLRAMLADADLYTSNPARYAKAADTLAEAEQRLAQTEERWLELELLREEVEGS